MTIETARTRINEIDTKLIELLCERMNLSHTIGRYKKENNLPVFDPAREMEIVARLKAAHPDSKELIEKIYPVIFDLSKKEQK
ncbi:MAG: chorismate mutase [Lactobacillales bacterium]|jgi:monofunctional chorismate mutase|nr:chorismate mutase [Lactobacillales bacterium]